MVDKQGDGDILDQIGEYISDSDDDATNGAPPMTEEQLLDESQNGDNNAGESYASNRVSDVNAQVINDHKSLIR